MQIPSAFILCTCHARNTEVALLKSRQNCYLSRHISFNQCPQRTGKDHHKAFRQILILRLRRHTSSTLRSPPSHHGIPRRQVPEATAAAGAARVWASALAHSRGGCRAPAAVSSFRICADVCRTASPPSCLLPTAVTACHGHCLRRPCWWCVQSSRCSLCTCRKCPYIERTRLRT